MCFRNAINLGMAKLWICLLVWQLVYVDSVPRQQRIVDLTHVFNNETFHYPTQKKFEVHILSTLTHDSKHRIQYEEYCSATHVGTHLDAPAHLIQGGLTVDKIPLERLIAPAAVVNVEDKAEKNRSYLVTTDDFKVWESETGQRLDSVILLIRTGWAKKYGNKEEYFGSSSDDTSTFRFPGMSLKAAQWLVNERNIYGYGIETLSIDNLPGGEVPIHITLLGGNIYGLEMLTNVDKLPAYGASLHVMPMKMGNGSGAPTRIIAILPGPINCPMQSSC